MTRRDRLIAERSERAQDRAAALRAGIAPTRQMLDDAPVMSAWSVYSTPGVGLGFGLEGVVAGHPRARFPTPMQTSAVEFMADDGSYCVTQGRFYRLGTKRHHAPDDPLAFEPSPDPDTERFRPR